MSRGSRNPDCDFTLSIENYSGRNPSTSTSNWGTVEVMKDNYLIVKWDYECIAVSCFSYYYVYITISNAYYNDGTREIYFDTITLKFQDLQITNEATGCGLAKCSSAPFSPNAATFSSRKFIHW